MIIRFCFILLSIVTVLSAKDNLDPYDDDSVKIEGKNKFKND